MVWLRQRPRGMPSPSPGLSQDTCFSDVVSAFDRLRKGTLHRGQDDSVGSSSPGGLVQFRKKKRPLSQRITWAPCLATLGMCTGAHTSYAAGATPWEFYDKLVQI